LVENGANSSPLKDCSMVCEFIEFRTLHFPVPPKSETIINFAEFISTIFRTGF